MEHVWLGCAPSRARGFSLIDAMAGIVVLLVIVLMLIGAIPASYGFTAQDSVRVQAVAAGQEYLDIIRQYVKSSGLDTQLPGAPVVPINLGRGFVSGEAQASPRSFSMTPSCAARSLFSYDCSVTVGWSVNGGPRQKVIVESYITSQAGF